VETEVAPTAESEVVPTVESEVVPTAESVSEVIIKNVIEPSKSKKGRKKKNA